jgi:hypothetical protein
VAVVAAAPQQDNSKQPLNAQTIATDKGQKLMEDIISTFLQRKNSRHLIMANWTKTCFEVHFKRI